jgi:predicted nucleic acid-binding protein
LKKNIQEKKVIITHAILIETINLLTKKLNKNTKEIIKAYKLIKHNFKIAYADEKLTERSIKTLVQYKANIGLADSLNIEVMKDFNIYEIVSFDPDFDNKENIIRIH